MFSRKANGAQGAGLSFLGAETVISGDLATSAQLHLEGRIEGNVRCIRFSEGPTGVVAGNIAAEEARIAGLVEGDVDAATVIVEGSARILGDITYETISIAAGAGIEGRLARRRALAASAPDPADAMLIATPRTAEPEVSDEAVGLLPLIQPRPRGRR